MAKDKSKKKESTGISDEFANPSEAPAGGDSWSLTDGDSPKSGKNDGKLFMITPLREDKADVTRGSKTESVDIIVADVVELNMEKPAKSEAHQAVFIWGKWVQGSLRGFIGTRRVLGRLVKTPDTGSAVGYVWKFEDAPAETAVAATAYLKSLDPFAVKAE